MFRKKKFLCRKYLDAFVILCRKSSSGHAEFPTLVCNYPTCVGRRMCHAEFR